MSIEAREAHSSRSSHQGVNVNRSGPAEGVWHHPPASRPREIDRVFSREGTTVRPVFPQGPVAMLHSPSRPRRAQVWRGASRREDHTDSREFMQALLESDGLPMADAANVEEARERLGDDSFSSTSWHGHRSAGRESGIRRASVVPHRASGWSRAGKTAERTGSGV
jgi:hypothetical protein